MGPFVHLVGIGFHDSIAGQMRYPIRSQHAHDFTLGDTAFCNKQIYKILRIGQSAVWQGRLANRDAAIQIVFVDRLAHCSNRIRIAMQDLNDKSALSCDGDSQRRIGDLDQNTQSVGPA
jgi:hypothetical protein